MSEEHNILISEWVKNEKNMLVYIGNPGSGKTYLCAALIKYCWPRFETGRYWKEKDFMKRLGGVMSQGQNAMYEVPFLIDDEIIIYDDLGSLGITDFKRDVIFEIIDTRYNSMKPTVITSNLTREELSRDLSPRVFSRLFAKENTIIEIRDIDKRGAPLAPPLPPDPLEGMAKKPWDKPK